MEAMAKAGVYKASSMDRVKGGGDFDMKLWRHTESLPGEYYRTLFKRTKRKRDLYCNANMCKKMEVCNGRIQAAPSEQKYFSLWNSTVYFFFSV